MQAETHARKSLEQATEYRDNALGAMREVSRHYHPYSLSTGAAQSAEDVAKSLTETFARIKGVAVAAELSEKPHGKIAKAERLIPSMVDTIRFVHEQTTERLDSLNLEKNLRAEVTDNLLPAMYLDRAANRAPNAEERHALEARAAQLHAALHQTDTAFSSLTKDRVPPSRPKPWPVPTFFSAQAPVLRVETVVSPSSITDSMPYPPESWPPSPSSTITT